jgi:hypothetical protein
MYRYNSACVKPNHLFFLSYPKQPTSLVGEEPPHLWPAFPSDPLGFIQPDPRALCYLLSVGRVVVTADMVALTVSQSVTTTLLAGSSWTTHTLLFFYFEYGDYLCNVVFLSSSSSSALTPSV